MQRESRIPVIAHLEGICHIYVDAHGRSRRRRATIVLNAKMRRTGVCGAAETLLVDRAVARAHLPPILADLHRGRLRDPRRRGGARARSARQAGDRGGLDTEYLDAILAVRVVDGVDGAIAHINRYGSHHTDAIVTEDEAAAERFLAEVDSAIVLHNASTQFADGGEFGMGAEIGISTGRLHAARAGRRRAAHQLQICRARQRPGAPLNRTRAIGIGRARRCARRVGLLGGSFNPAHEGHRHVSLEALKRLGLDEVWWLVSPQNPLKPVAGMAPFASALRRRAARSRAIRASSVLDLEARLGTRYTVDTVDGARRLFPAHAFRLADGRRQSEADPPLEALAGDLSRAAHCRARPAYLFSSRLGRARRAILRAVFASRRARRGASPT